MPKLPQTANPAARQDVRKIAQKLKSTLLASAEPLLKQYIDAALGEGELKSTNLEARTEVWGLVKHVILSAGDMLDIQVGTPEGIIHAVASGNCTADEGRQLLSLYRQVSDIKTQERGAALASKQGGGGLNITIMTNSKDNQSHPIDITPKLEQKK